MLTGELPAPIVADLSSLEALDQSLDQKGTDHPIEGLYPRDGMPLDIAIEQLVSNVTIPGHSNNIIWASGMAALIQTTQFATSYMRQQGTRSGDYPVVANSAELYSQSGALFAKEESRGVKVYAFDCGDQNKENRVILPAGAEAYKNIPLRPTDKIHSIKALGADVIVAETVANTPEMPVPDIRRWLELLRGLENPPIVIFDNTLPLSTGINFDDLLLPSDGVIVVESGTKNLMNNSGLLGISYSKNMELMTALRQHRSHSGAVVSPDALPVMLDKLQRTVPGFHDRNRAVFRSTGKIARALAEARDELGKNSDFEVSYPAFTNHNNHDYASRITPGGGDFPSPVVFIGPTREFDARPLIARIALHPAMREQIAQHQIHLGQSFGAPRGRLLYDRRVPNVRFSGGYDVPDENALAAAIKEALADK